MEILIHIQKTDHCIVTTAQLIGHIDHERKQGGGYDTKFFYQSYLL